VQDGILILDAETGKIIDVNPFLLDLLDYPFETMIGLQLWELGQFKDIAANQTAFEALQTNEYIRYENLPLRTKAGKEIQVEFVSNVYVVGSEKVIQCNIRDISARSKADEASRGRIATLERASTTKDDVLATLSHELRTPLTAISCATDLLELGHDVTDVLSKTDVPPQFDRSAVAMIRRNLLTLVRLINELLDITHMEKGTLYLKLETIDAHEVIRFAIKNLENQQKSTGVGIEFHLQALHSGIRADSNKLEQVLSNLIGNALKFTPEGGKVRVDCASQNAFVYFAVSDTGVGIRLEDQQVIFQEFRQVGETTRGVKEGTGLGLYIVKEAIEKVGGTIAVHSNVGRGTTFKITLPTKINS